VYDWFPGNGFIGSLLGREGLSVTGIADNTPKPNQIASFYDPDYYRFQNRGDLSSSCDLVLASWVPSQVNPTPDILTLDPRLIAYIYTEHVNADNGQRQTGTDDMFDDLKGRYVLVDSWTVTRPKDLLHEIWPDMTPNIEETRITKVYAAADLTVEKIPSVTDSESYDWEKELQMATLALEAKQELRSRGMGV
ncbi:MAG: hypothetical protein PVJ39_15050, partial [Gammaproteobacteria bacterium]